MENAVADCKYCRTVDGTEIGQRTCEVKLVILMMVMFRELNIVGQGLGGGSS